MASHVDMKKLGDDPDAVKRLAVFLLTLDDAGWTEWERLFLESLSDRRSTEPLSQRQREILVDLRDSVQSFTQVRGFSVAMLIRACWEHRLDLEDDDLDFVERLKADGPKTLKRRAAYRILACAHRLDVVPRFAEAG
jgi:hypothetical protein